MTSSRPAPDAPQNYLVTGCAGFIGSGVCRALLAGGHHVVGVDNLNAAYDPRLKSWRLAELTPHERFHFRQVDITQRSSVRELFAERSPARFDAVFHLAARAGVRPSVVDPWIYYQTNLDGVLHVLDACRELAVPKFVLASSSSVYGGASSGAFCETQPTDRPLSPYAASKKAAEVLAYSYHHLHGLDVSALRFFTVYGPAGRPDMSIFRFVRQIIEGEPLIVFGDGSQRRDFTYVDDIVRGTIAAARPLGFQAINLGSDHPVALSDVIQKIAQRVGKPPHIEYRPADSADVDATWANISAAERLLGWRPETSLDAGLDAAIAWYREHRELALQIAL